MIDCASGLQETIKNQLWRGNGRVWLWVEIQGVDAGVKAFGVATGTNFRAHLLGMGGLELVAPDKHACGQLRQRLGTPLLTTRFAAVALPG